MFMAPEFHFVQEQVVFGQAAPGKAVSQIAVETTFLAMGYEMGLAT